MQEVLALGNPGDLVDVDPGDAFCLGWWLTRRDWRAGSALLGIAAGWLTWFPFVSRTKFYYYALEFEPFLIICIVLCLGLIIGPARPAWPRRAIGAAIAGAYVLAVLMCSGTFTRSSRARSSRTRPGFATCGTTAGSSPASANLPACPAVPAYERFLRVG